MVGVSVVIRDSNNDFMVCRMHKYHGLIEAREAETKALIDVVRMSLKVSQLSWIHDVTESSCYWT